jgi:hypothetical protein
MKLETMSMVMVTIKKGVYYILENLYSGKSILNNVDGIQNSKLSFCRFHVYDQIAFNRKFSVEYVGK